LRSSPTVQWQGDGRIDKVEFEKYYDAQNAAIQQFHRERAAENKEAANMKAAASAFTF